MDSSTPCAGGKKREGQLERMCLDRVRERERGGRRRERKRGREVGGRWRSSSLPDAHMPHRGLLEATACFSAAPTALFPSGLGRREGGRGHVEVKRGCGLVALHQRLRWAARLNTAAALVGTLPPSLSEVRTAVAYLRGCQFSCGRGRFVFEEGRGG